MKKMIESTDKLKGVQIYEKYFDKLFKDINKEAITAEIKSTLNLEDVKALEDKTINPNKLISELEDDVRKAYEAKEAEIGTDNLRELYWWGYIDSLLSKYKILVIERGKDKIDDIIESQEFLQKYRDSFIKYNQQIRTNLSSTYVRNKIKEGKDVRYLMPDKIYNYIKENNLYRS